VVSVGFHGRPLCEGKNGPKKGPAPGKRGKNSKRGHKFIGIGRVWVLPHTTN